MTFDPRFLPALNRATRRGPYGAGAPVATAGAAPPPWLFVALAVVALAVALAVSR